MSYKSCGRALAATAAVTFLALSATVDSREVPTQAAQPPAQSSAAAVQPEIDRLRFRQGVWDVTMEFTPAPGAKPVSAKGVQTNRLMDGGWLISDLEAEMMGRPFRGHGVNGYDSNQKKYVGVWIDSMRSYVTHVEGTYENDGRTFRTTSQERDQTGRMVPSTQVTETIDQNTERTTLTAQAPDGKTFTRMTITYRRRV